MTGWLALVGGSEWTDGCTFDADLLALSRTTEVTILPTAAAFENPDASVAHARNWFANHNATTAACSVLNRHDAENPELCSQLKNAKFIYIGGGNPMHLRSTLKDTPAFDALAQAWRSGATLAASSAGAMALCDPMLDPRGGAFTIGLGLLSNVAVLPHANTWAEERLKRTKKLANKNITLAMIDEKTALVRSPGGVWKTEGAGTVRIHAHGSDTSDCTMLSTLSIVLN